MSETGLNEAATNIATALQRPSLAPVWLTVFAICFDLPVFATALWFAQYAAVSPSDFAPLSAAGLGFLIAAASVGLLALGGGYRPNVMRKPKRAMLGAFLALAGPVTLAGSLAADAWSADFANFLLASFLALACVIIPLRLIETQVVAWIIDSGLIQRRAVIAGGGEHAERLIRGLSARTESDVHLYGIFDDRDDDRSPPQVIGA